MEGSCVANLLRRSSWGNGEVIAVIQGSENGDEEVLFRFLNLMVELMYSLLEIDVSDGDRES